MLRNPLVVVAVILESRSPGSVVIKLGLDSGTLRARSSWAAKTLRGFLLMSFPNVVVGNLSLLLLFSSEKANPRRTLRAASPSGMMFAFCLLLHFKSPWWKGSCSSFVVAVILESRSPGSVVIKQGKIVPLFGLYTQNARLIYPRTLRAGSLRAACSPLG